MHPRLRSHRSAHAPNMAVWLLRSGRTWWVPRVPSWVPADFHEEYPNRSEYARWVDMKLCYLHVPENSSLRHGLPLFSQVELGLLQVGDPEVIQIFSDFSWQNRRHSCGGPVLGNPMVAATLLRRNQGTARSDAIVKISPSGGIYYVDEQLGVKENG